MDKEEVRKIMETDIVKKLDDLIIQATKERSHYYVKSVAEEAKIVILLLRTILATERAAGKERQKMVDRRVRGEQKD